MVDIERIIDNLTVIEQHMKDVLNGVVTLNATGIMVTAGSARKLAENIKEEAIKLEQALESKLVDRNIP